MEMNYPENQVALTPPHSMEAERAVIGALLYEGHRIEEVTPLVASRDFYHARHRLIFGAMEQMRLAETPIDMVTVAEYMQSTGDLDQMDGGLSYLEDLLQCAPSAANISAYAQIILDRSRLRQLITTSRAISEKAFRHEGEAVADIISDAQQQVMEITAASKSDMMFEFDDATRLMIKQLDARHDEKQEAPGVPTGLDDLDNYLGRMMPGKLIIVGGRPSMGKSAFALNCAEEAAKAGHLTMFFSLEMEIEEIMQRLYSNQANVPMEQITKHKLSPEFWERITGTFNKLQGLPLHFDMTAGITLEILRSRIRRLVYIKGRPARLVVVDYVQLMKHADRRLSRYDVISDISRGLKEIAKEFQCTVMALSQLSRDIERRPLEDRRPRMSDLKESGSIEQDADIIIFPYRDSVYNANTRMKNAAELIIAKFKNGKTGKVYVDDELHYSRFANRRTQDLGLPDPIDTPQGGLDYQP